MYVRVKVVPKAKKETVKKINDNTYQITVKEPAERNLANLRVKELLAQEYNARTKDLRLISGHHSGNKIFSIEDNLKE